MIRAVLSVLLLTATAAAQEAGPQWDPSRDTWARWKPGTYVMYHCTSTYNGDESEFYMTRRLESVGKDSIVISERQYDGADGSEVARDRWTFPHPKFAGKESATVLGKETVVVAPGFSCRRQIEHFTGLTALHPAELLWSLIGKAGNPAKTPVHPASP